MSDPAFPTPALVDRFGDIAEPQQPGLTARAYYAARAMQSMCGVPWPDARDMPEIARRSWAMADAMLAAEHVLPDLHEPFR